MIPTLKIQSSEQLKQANIPNSLNTPFYYENAYFMLYVNAKIPLNLKSHSMYIQILFRYSNTRLTE